ncbi:MAG: ABC transporter permease subunit [Clostridiales bacterium]|nr:ABC transporter permease subunit [Clostridiales bacterium]
MDNIEAVNPPQAKPDSGKLKKTSNYLKRYWTLYLLLLLPLVYFIIFRYIPMFYVQIAFKEYRLNMPIWEMEWADNYGFKYFIEAFRNRDFRYAIRNTLGLNLLDLVVGFPAPIILAVLLNELPFRKFKRLTQTVSYMPHFLSWIIIASLANQLFATSTGLVNIFINNLGMESIHFLDREVNWIITFCLLGVWQNLGWGSIIYLAAITGISPELYEAAAVDGASRLRKIWHITLPGIRSTIVTLLIMNLGRIIGSDFDRPWALRNQLVKGVSDVLSIFVYVNGITSSKFELATAVGLFQSVVCLIFLLGSNALAKKFGERGVW